ncbi:hypothetical protein B0H10DRAFT_2106171, partial [Mycena sp. CBHHK59/15]
MHTKFFLLGWSSVLPLASARRLGLGLVVIVTDGEGRLAVVVEEEEGAAAVRCVEEELAVMVEEEDTSCASVDKSARGTAKEARAAHPATGPSRCRCRCQRPSPSPRHAASSARAWVRERKPRFHSHSDSQEDAPPPREGIPPAPPRIGCTRAAHPVPLHPHLLSFLLLLLGAAHWLLLLLLLL